MALVTLNTLDGIDLNPSGGEFTTELIDGWPRTEIAARSAKTTERPDRWGTVAGQALAERRMRVRHLIGGATGLGGAHEANLSTVRGLYGVGKKARTLRYTDGDGEDKEVTVVLESITSYNGVCSGGVIGNWNVIDGISLEKETQTVTAQSKTSSPATIPVANRGNVPTSSATITLSPTAAKSAANGQRFRYPVTPLVRTTTPLSSWPTDITGGGWDHATEVSASRSQSDGDDVEVYVNGRRVPRWAGLSGTSNDWNQSTTQIWVNLDHPAERFWTAQASMGSGDTSVVLNEPLTNMPEAPFYAVLDGAANETILVSSYDADTRTMTIARGKRGTTATTASAGNKIYHAPVLIDLVYGGTSLAAPDYVDDDFKPMFLSNTTSNSTNAAFVYEVFQQTEASGRTQARLPRSAAWFTAGMGQYDREKKDGRGDMYWRWIPYTGSTATTDAATAARMYITYNDDGPKTGHPLRDRWMITSPIDVASTTYDYATTLASGSSFRFGRMEVKSIDADGLEVVNEKFNVDDYTPSSGSGKTTTFDGDGVRTIMFVVVPYDPNLDSTANQTAGAPATGTQYLYADNVTLTFKTTKSTQILFGSSRENIYQFGRPDAAATLANSDGETLSLWGLVVAIDDTLSIDVDSGSIVNDADGRDVGGLVTGTFPKLPGGTEDLTYTETGIGTVELGVSAFRSAWR